MIMSRGSAIATALLASGVLTVSACDYWVTSHDGKLTAGRPECPEGWANATIPMWTQDPAREAKTKVTVDLRSPPSTASGDTYTVPPTGLAVSGPITDIPEFHDCQKFIKKDRSGYDSLYAVFAAYNLDSLVSALQFEVITWASNNPAVATVSASGLVTALTPDTTTITGTPVADPTRKVSVLITVSNNAQVGPHAPLTVSGVLLQSPPLHPADVIQLVARVILETRKTIAAAEIYTYGVGYGPLGLGPDFSCLYLYYDGFDAFKAQMVMVGNPGTSVTACAGAYDPRNPGTNYVTELTVTKRDAPSNKDLPAAARWDFDAENGQYYIGIKCGTAWCEVGNNGARAFRTSAPMLVSAAATAGEVRVLRGKGWYDQQELAMVTDSHATIPSGIVATVIPAPDLATYTKANYDTGFVLTGYIVLDPTRAATGALKYYKDKFNLDAVPFDGILEKQNTLWLCHGTRTFCGVPADHAGKSCGWDSFFGYPIRRVWSRIVAPGGGKMFRCNRRREATGMGMGQYVAATARWRWIASDETVWEYCAAAGCCEIASDR